MKTMFSHVCLTLLLVIASGDLTFSQSTVAPTGSATAAATTVGRTTLKPTTPTSPTTTTSTSAPNTTTQASPTTIAPTPANTTTLAPTPANTTTLAPTPANTTTLAPTPANTTTLAPTPANTTTLAPTPANTTTLAPTPANTTTLAPTSPPLPKPQTGNYTLRANVSSTACLMARMGLQINFKQGTDTQSMNLDPGATNVSGSCSSNGSDSVLNLHSETIGITFTFTNATNRFHLRALNVVVMSGGANFTDGNNSLSLWQASVGSSYMCKKEQSDEITALLTLKTFDLQIQPFAVENNKFSTAHECAMDDSSILIPIIVGAALAGLILIVVIAYMIGRRKTYVGYQTL